MTLARENTSHRPRKATSSSTRVAVTTILRLRAARAREWTRSGVLTVSTTGVLSTSGDMGGTPLTGDADLFAEGLPDLAVDLDEPRLQAHGLDLARPRQVDVEDVLDGGGPGRHDDDLVGQRDGLLQVVGDEDDRGARALPPFQQLGR